MYLLNFVTAFLKSHLVFMIGRYTYYKCTYTKYYYIVTLAMLRTHVFEKKPNS